MIEPSHCFDLSSVSIGSSIDDQIYTLCRYVQPNANYLQNLIITYTTSPKRNEFADVPIQILKTVFVKSVEILFNSNIESSVKAVGNFIGPPLDQSIKKIPTCIKTIPIDDFNVTISNLDLCLLEIIEETVTITLQIMSSVRNLTDSFCNSWNNVGRSSDIKSLINKASNISNSQGPTLKLYSQQTVYSFGRFASLATNTSSCIYSNGAEKLANELAEAYGKISNCLRN